MLCPTDNDFKDAAIVIMSVKPVKLESDDALAALNQARIFQHSVPFTKSGGVHAKNIDEQWKRITLFEVHQPFPSAVYRQRIQKKTVRDLSPVEVAIDDIEIRNEAMMKELLRDKRDGADTNNLMRIIQGSVMPQVNGGITEVAKVFLPLVGQEEIADRAVIIDPRFRVTLKDRLVVFLDISKQLLSKAGKALFEDVKKLNVKIDAMDDDVSAKVQALKKRHQEHESNVIWMKEMERGYALLMQTMSFYLGDLLSFQALDTSLLKKFEIRDADAE